MEPFSKNTSLVTLSRFSRRTPDFWPVSRNCRRSAMLIVARLPATPMFLLPLVSRVTAAEPSRIRPPAQAFPTVPTPPEQDRRVPEPAVLLAASIRSFGLDDGSDGRSE